MPNVTEMASGKKKGKASAQRTYLRVRNLLQEVQGGAISVWKHWGFTRLVMNPKFRVDTVGVIYQAYNLICTLLSMKEPRIQSKDWVKLLLIYKELRNCDGDAG